MQTSIKLQEPFTYSMIPLIISIVLVVIGFCYLIYMIKMRKKAKVEVQQTEIKAIPERYIRNIPEIKARFLNKLDSVEYKYANNMIELRKAYQLVSEVVRLFVFEVTDIKTQNYSLIEIQRLNIPPLYELIKEYYEPEFASKSIGDFSRSINKARRVISEWN